MCSACYVGLTGGVSPPVTDAMRHAARLVRRVYDSAWGGAGGPLHVWVDDMNLDEESLDEEVVKNFPEEFIRQYWGDELSPDDWKLCADALYALQVLSVPERAFVVYHGKDVVL